jgi:hypothetical protein
MFAMLNNQRVNHGIARCPLASQQDEHIAKHENPIKTIPETNHLGVMSSCFIIPNTDWVYPNMIQKLTHSAQCYIWGWFICLLNMVCSYQFTSDYYYSFTARTRVCLKIRYTPKWQC